MTVLRFYRLSLILPVLVPSALILLFFVAPGLVTAIANLGLSMPFAVIVYSLVYGGVPYAAFAAWAAWFIGGKSEAEIRRLLLTMPLLMAGVALFCFAAISAATGALSRASTLLTVGAIASVGLGYTYVGTVLLARKFMTLTENPEPKFEV